MAERVNSMPERIRGRAQFYPLGEWFDGSVWLLKPGEDFTCKPRSLRTYLATVASKRGLELNARIRDEGVYIQATPRSAPSERDER